VARKSFSIHGDYYNELRNLTTEQRGDVLLALVDWANEDDDKSSSTLDPLCSMLVRLMVSQLDREDRRELKRDNAEYREWRMEVFKRDKYTCQHCRMRGGILNAHHIKYYSSNPSLRTEIDNGITLCVICHKKIHMLEGYNEIR